MSDEITRVIEQDAKRVGKAVADGAGKAIREVLHDAKAKLVKNVESHELHDRNAASDLEKAAKHGDETPQVHGANGGEPTPSSGGGTSAVHKPPTVGGGAGKTDANGRTHNPDGTFAPEGGGRDAQQYIDRATKGSKQPRDLAGDRSGYDATLAARTDAAGRKASAGREIDDLANKYGADAKALRKGDRRALQDLRRAGATPDEVRQAQQAARAHRQADIDLHRRSEQLGVQAGENVLTQDGYRQISGSSERAGRPGEADLIGVSPDGQSIKVIEAKGGTASLGEGRYLPDHNPPGRAEQGSGAYLDDLLKRDPEFQRELQSNPALQQAYRSGTLKIDYTLVSAGPSGRVTETPLVSR